MVIGGQIIYVWLDQHHKSARALLHMWCPLDDSGRSPWLACPLMVATQDPAYKVLLKQPPQGLSSAAHCHHQRCRNLRSEQGPPKQLLHYGSAPLKEDALHCISIRTNPHFYWARAITHPRHHLSIGFVNCRRGDGTEHLQRASTRSASVLLQLGQYLVWVMSTINVFSLHLLENMCQTQGLWVNLAHQGISCGPRTFPPPSKSQKLSAFPR